MQKARNRAFAASHAGKFWMPPIRMSTRKLAANLLLFILFASAAASASAMQPSSPTRLESNTLFLATGKYSVPALSLYGTSPNWLPPVEGSARMVTFGTSLRQVLPSGWKVYSDNPLDESQRFDWAGPRNWVVLVNEFLSTTRQQAALDWDAKTLTLYSGGTAKSAILPHVETASVPLGGTVATLPVIHADPVMVAPGALTGITGSSPASTTTTGMLAAVTPSAATTIPAQGEPEKISKKETIDSPPETSAEPKVTAPAVSIHPTPQAQLPVTAPAADAKQTWVLHHGRRLDKELRTWAKQAGKEHSFEWSAGSRWEVPQDTEIPGKTFEEAVEFVVTSLYAAGKPIKLNVYSNGFMEVISNVSN